MVESGWTMSKVTQEHLQNLVSRGYMIVAELATCLLPVDPAFPAPVGGVRRGMCNILRARMHCAVTLISPFVTAVLWIGAASFDSFRDPAYGSHHDPVRGHNWD
jgi:hypothetical protein